MFIDKEMSAGHKVGFKKKYVTQLTEIQKVAVTLHAEEK